MNPASSCRSSPFLSRMRRARLPRISSFAAPSMRPNGPMSRWVTKMLQQAAAGIMNKRADQTVARRLKNEKAALAGAPKVNDGKVVIAGRYKGKSNGTAKANREHEPRGNERLIP